MTTRKTQSRHGRLAALVGTLGVLVAGALLGGCSSTPAPSFSALFRSASPQSEPNALAQPEVECPSVSIRQGAATYSVSADPKETTALNLRYQVGIGETARECRLAAGMVTMRVGIEGRVVLGPAGGPGAIEVPLRFALVQEGTGPKTIISKLQRVPVVVPENQPNVAFTHIEEDLSFPLPRGSLIDSYVLYVGFDPLGAQELKRKQPPPKKGRKKT